MRILIAFFILSISIFFSNASAQNWEFVCSTKNQNVRSLFVDTSENVVYIGGHFRSIIDGNDTIDARGIVKWDGESFETLDSFPNKHCNNWNCDPVFSITKFQDNIYATLINAAGGPEEIRGLARWNGIEWDSLGKGLEGGVFEQIIYQDELYVMGRFRAGDDYYEANGIAKWDGSQWHQVDFPYVLPDGSFSITIVGAMVYNGDFYVVGNFFDEEETARDVARFDGENWYPVGEPIKGGFDDVSDIIVFQDEIYICGGFRSGSGNAGNKMMKLVNGSWTDVGGSFDAESDQARRMTIYQGKLYVVGGFDSVGQGVPAHNIAVWDGEKWCGLGSEMSPSRLNSIVEFQGDLIVAGNFDTIDNVVVEEIARWTGGNYLDTCGAIVTAVEEEVVLAEEEMKVYPSPADDYLFIEFSEVVSSPEKIVLYDILGKPVISNVVSTDEFIVQLQTASLSNGTYIIAAYFESLVLTRKVVINH